MNKLTDDRLCEAIKNDSYIEVKDLKEMKKQPNVQELYLKLNKYEKLEAELGCPLEVIAKLFGQKFIYFKYPANVQIMKVKVIKGLSYGSNLGWYFTCIYDNLNFIYISLRDYKKAWWLKEDRSE